MTIAQLQQILSENNISEKACQIYPQYVPEGALCLLKEDDKWIVQLNERGSWIINEKFGIESEAVNFFLKRALADPTCRIDFKASDLSSWPTQRANLFKKYGLE